MKPCFHEKINKLDWIVICQILYSNLEKISNRDLLENMDCKMPMGTPDMSLIDRSIATPGLNRSFAISPKFNTDFDDVSSLESVCCLLTFGMKTMTRRRLESNHDL